MSEGLLKGKTALITGGAGAIGRAVAAGFAGQGACVHIQDIDGERLSRVAAELRARFGERCIMDRACDVRSPAAARQCVEDVVSRLGRLDILVNNAAVTRIRKIDETQDADIDAILDTNLKGYFYFAREAVRAMKKDGAGGVILTVSSKNGLEGASEKSLYCAAKGGELAMSRALARELGPFGIRVNSICPDAVHEGSKLWERGGDYSVGTARRYSITEDEIPEYYRQRCALKVCINPEDIANAALFLCSPMSAKVTGAILTVDGGVVFVR